MALHEMRKSGIAQRMESFHRSVMQSLFGLFCAAFLMIGSAAGQAPPQAIASGPDSPPAGRGRSQGNPLESAGFDGPGMGKPGYRATWYPSQPITQSPAEMSLFRQGISAGYPIWREENDTVLLMAGVRNTQFSTSAILPDSRKPFPDELWAIDTGIMYIHKFDNGWSGAVRASLGSASDKPYDSMDEINLNFFGFLQTQVSNDTDYWIFSIFYSPMGNLTFPIPGIAYLWKPSEQFNMSIGIPFSIKWTPIEDLTLTFSYLPVININARANYRVRDGFELYGGFEWLNEAYFLADRSERRDRFLVFEKRLITGIRWDLCPHAVLDLNGGYAFDRYFGQGQNLFSNMRDRLDIGSGAFVGANLIVKW
ncbi:MAG: DUF6268 family outer membrane beta-barrel protein [Zavarzinella sp.]